MLIHFEAAKDASGDWRSGHIGPQNLEIHNETPLLRTSTTAKRAEWAGLQGEKGVADWRVSNLPSQEREGATEPPKAGERKNEPAECVVSLNWSSSAPRPSEAG